MKTNTIWLCAIIALMTMLSITSCEKEIDVDYNRVPPKLVMNGIITPDSIVFTLQYTVDVTTPLDAEVTPLDAQVKITGDDGAQYLLTRQPIGSNRFVALNNLGQQIGGVQGVSYTAEAHVGDDIIQGNSTLTAPISVENLAFEWVEFTGDNRQLFLTFDWQDVPGEENYYHYLIKRTNGEAYSWSIRSDEGEDGNLIHALNRCMSSEDTAEDEPDDYLEAGETLIVEMRQIDRNTYYYLLSVMVGENSTSNPIPFYTGEDYLGYFEACTPLRFAVTYHEESN